MLIFKLFINSKHCYENLQPAARQTFYLHFPTSLTTCLSERRRQPTSHKHIQARKTATPSRTNFVFLISYLDNENLYYSCNLKSAAWVCIRQPFAQSIRLHARVRTSYCLQ